MNWQELRNAKLDELLAWSETQPWCQAMVTCHQDAEWHAEGDVWTHTQSVCQQLTLLEDWYSLTSHEQTVLRFTALLHDVAKPLTTRVAPDTGRISSPKHAVKGEHIARQILRDLGCDLATREQIAGLVRYHGRPVFLLERTEPIHEVVRMSWLVDNRLLYLFAIADARGRDTGATDRSEDNLHLWKLQAEEQSCYLQPFPFENDQARFTFLSERQSDLHYVPHDEFGCHVTMLSGLPGSGKDYWLSRNCPKSPVVSLDAIRNELKVRPTDDQGAVVQTARERCREYLRSSTSFAFNATNIFRQTRSRWVDLFVDYGAKLKLVYIEPPFPQLLRQNKARQAAVPESVICKLASKCEPPTWNECHELIVADGNTD